MTIVSGVHSDYHVASSRTYALNLSINDILVEALQHGFALQPLSCSICKTPLVKLVEDNENHDLSNRTKPTVSISTSTAAFKKSTKDFLSEHMPECFMKGICFCVKCKAHVVTSDTELSLLAQMSSDIDADNTSKGSIIFSIDGKHDVRSYNHTGSNNEKEIGLNEVIELANLVDTLKAERQELLNLRKCVEGKCRANILRESSVLRSCQDIMREREEATTTKVTELLGLIETNSEVYRRAVDERTAIENNVQKLQLNTAEALKRKEEQLLRLRNAESDPTLRIVDKLVLEDEFQSAESTFVMLEAQSSLACQELMRANKNVEHFENLKSDFDSPIIHQIQTLHQDLADANTELKLKMAECNKLVYAAETCITKLEHLFSGEDGSYLLFDTLESSAVSKSGIFQELKYIGYLRNCLTALTKDDVDFNVVCSVMTKEHYLHSENQKVVEDDQSTGVTTLFHTDTEKNDTDDIRALITREIGLRMLNGWILLDSPCPKCTVPLMSEKEGWPSECVVCGLMTHDKPGEECEKEIEALIRDTVVRKLDGWRLFDFTCPEYPVPLVMEQEKIAVTSILCNSAASVFSNESVIMNDETATNSQHTNPNYCDEADDKPSGDIKSHSLEPIISREIGIRMLNGWIMLKSACPRCATPLMSPKEESSALCIICEPEVQVPDATDESTLDSFETEFKGLVSREIGDRLLNGWRVLDTACPKCLMPLMSDKDETELICVVCGQFDQPVASKRISDDTSGLILNQYNIADRSILDAVGLSADEEDEKAIESTQGYVDHSLLPNVPILLEDLSSNSILSKYPRPVLKTRVRSELVFASNDTSNPYVDYTASNDPNSSSSLNTDETVERTTRDVNLAPSDLVVTGSDYLNSHITDTFCNDPKHSPPLSSDETVERTTSNTNDSVTSQLLVSVPAESAKASYDSYSLSTDDVPAVIHNTHDVGIGLSSASDPADYRQVSTGATMIFEEVEQTKYVDKILLTVNAPEPLCNKSLDDAILTPNPVEVTELSCDNTAHSSVEAVHTVDDMGCVLPNHSHHDAECVHNYKSTDEGSLAIDVNGAVSPISLSDPEHAVSVLTSRSVAITTLKALEQKIDASKDKLCSPLDSENDIVKELVGRLKLATMIEKMAQAAVALKKEAHIE